jgi:predicted nucleic acid-binding protein
MRAIFHQVNGRTLQVITSVITLTEVLMMPIQTNHIQYQQEYSKMLLNMAHITTLSVSSAIADRAAYLRAQFGTRTPDALRMATAIISGCDAFLTNDFALSRVRDVRVSVLDELELDERPVSESRRVYVELISTERERRVY